jgi:hypothetical protein
MNTPSQHPSGRQRLIVPFGFALLWVVMSLATKDVTFHLGPLIVAAAAPLPSRHRRLAWAVVGLTMAVGTAMVLAATGAMTGPSLLPFGGALLESVVLAIVGAGLGLVLAGRVSAHTNHNTVGQPTV